MLDGMRLVDVTHVRGRGGRNTMFRSSLLFFVGYPVNFEKIRTQRQI